MLKFPSVESIRFNLIALGLRSAVLHSITVVRSCCVCSSQVPAEVPAEGDGGAAGRQGQRLRRHPGQPPAQDAGHQQPGQVFHPLRKQEYDWSLLSSCTTEHVQMSLKTVFLHLQICVSVCIG